MIQGDSTSEDIAYKIKSYAKNFKNVMVCLDSNHTHEHVLKELLLYSNLTSVGNYCIVWGTIIEDMPEDYCTDRSWSNGNNPKTAVWEFLKTNDNF